MSENNWFTALKKEGAVHPRQTLADEAADNLREFILLEKLPAGTPIPERELAEALGISRTPLREALRLLEVEGLVEYSSTRRPRVADPSFEELVQFIKVLGALEALGGELACAEASDAEIQKILKLNARMANGLKTKDPLEFFRLDMLFHTSIIEASRNLPLIETHRQYNARLWRARFVSSRRATRRERTLQEHDDISVALQARDGVAAGIAMRSHLNTAIKNIALAQAEDSDT
ncbi:GntR family transcriptional regulator [Candidatus Halocynthiibacter alkanivorans]|jgi:DNA-binding GntR family transcriptional regulator|uniref:GntR family transcriptional regulator n=1 Tax=Candidatus Halocynthiibacter alkanivorans TaxID=2267619 RepID=UPI000DF3009C|nr:GntR family transcriptional regulator [Candidatus Halocynthiibacter alkanivorans]